MTLLFDHFSFFFTKLEQMKWYWY